MLGEVPKPPPRQGDIHCPFCPWNRVETRHVSSPVFDRAAAIAELAEHLRDIHPLDWQHLRGIA